MSTFSNFTANIKIGTSVLAEVDETPVGAGWTVIAGGAIYTRNVISCPANQFIRANISLYSTGNVFASLHSHAHMSAARLADSTNLSAMKALSDVFTAGVGTPTQVFQHKDMIQINPGQILALYTLANQQVFFGVAGTIFFNG